MPQGQLRPPSSSLDEPRWRRLPLPLPPETAWLRHPPPSLHRDFQASRQMAAALRCKLCRSARCSRAVGCHLSVLPLLPIRFRRTPPRLHRRPQCRVQTAQLRLRRSLLLLLLLLLSWCLFLQRAPRHAPCQMGVARRPLRRCSALCNPAGGPRLLAALPPMPQRRRRPQRWLSFLLRSRRRRRLHCRFRRRRRRRSSHRRCRGGARLAATAWLRLASSALTSWISPLLRRTRRSPNQRRRSSRRRQWPKCRLLQLSILQRPRHHRRRSLRRRVHRGLACAARRPRPRSSAVSQRHQLPVSLHLPQPHPPTPPAQQSAPAAQAAMGAAGPPARAGRRRRCRAPPPPQCARRRRRASRLRRDAWRRGAPCGCARVGCCLYSPRRGACWL